MRWSIAPTEELWVSGLPDEFVGVWIPWPIAPTDEFVDSWIPAMARDQASRLYRALRR